MKPNQVDFNMEANGDYFTPEAALKIGKQLQCEIEPPFWYPCCQIKRKKFGPIGDLNDMAFVKLMQPVEKKDWLREIGVDKKEMYLPGEIYKSKVVKEMFLPLNTDESCTGIWSPRMKGFYEKLRPEEFIPLTYPLYERVMQREKMYLNHESVSTLQSSQAQSSSGSRPEESLPILRTENEDKIKKRKSCIFYGDSACKEHVHIPGTNPCCRRYTVERK